MQILVVQRSRTVYISNDLLIDSAIVVDRTSVYCNDEFHLSHLWSGSGINTKLSCVHTIHPVGVAALKGEYLVVISGLNNFSQLGFFVGGTVVLILLSPAANRNTISTKNASDASISTHIFSVKVKLLIPSSLRLDP